MKRFLSAMMVSVFLTLTFSIGLVAMAGEIKYTDVEDDTGLVGVTYKEDTTKLVPEYEYYINFENLNFVYKKQYKEVWQDEYPYYKKVLESEGWTTAEGTVSIRNESNVGLTFEVTYAGGGANFPEGCSFTVTGGESKQVSPKGTMTAKVKPNFTPSNLTKDLNYDGGEVHVSVSTIPIFNGD